MNLRNILAKFISCFCMFNKIIPKNPKLILFYSNTGYKDNLSVLHKYLLQNGYNNKYKIIFSINNHTVYNNKKFVSNISGIFYFFRAKYVFYYNGKIPIHPSKGQYVVNLWHGIPLKKIGRLTRPNVFIDFSTHYVVPSEKVGEIFIRCFGCDESKLVFCGAPRNDLLFSKEINEQIKSMLNKKTVFWLPTFKASDFDNIKDSDLSLTSTTGLPILHTKKDLDNLNSYLKDNQINLIIKLHPMEKNKYLLGLSFTNILTIDDNYLFQNDIELYSILGVCDAILTDYSSVYFDYLLCNRPIGFILEDISSYKSNRGFTLDNPLSVMPGMHIYTENMLYDFFNNLLRNIDSYESERLRIKKEWCGEFLDENIKTLLHALSLNK